MVRAAQDILGDHLINGIASVPYGIQETLKKAGKLSVPILFIYQFF